MSNLARIFYLIKTLLFYVHTFKKFGLKTILQSPLKIEGAKNIVIGNRVMIGYKTWLAAVPLQKDSECVLEIHEGCSIGNFNHIYATQLVIIEKNVLIADKVYISDNLHGYEDVKLPIIKQPVVQNSTVIIGEGSWIGENACILGANLGKNSVVGSNAVVTKDIPDYCVAVGIPAKIIKRYDSTTGSWRKTNEFGTFVNSSAI